MPLPFGLTVVPNRPYQRLMEVRALGEQPSFELRLDPRLAGVLAIARRMARAPWRPGRPLPLGG